MSNEYKPEIQERIDAITDDLGICGCGQPRTAINYVEKILGMCNPDKWEELDAVLNARGDMRGAFVLYALDRAGYIEHGGSIYCSWLTEEGEAALNLLQVERHI